MPGAVLGILGITLLWDALEMTRQQRRICKGHAHANPDNPRHARILEQYPACRRSTCSNASRLAGGSKG
jgi:hypothetical protein